MSAFAEILVEPDHDNSDPAAGLLAYVLTAVGPNGRRFGCEFYASVELLDDPEAFGAVVDGALQSAYGHLLAEASE